MSSAAEPGREVLLVAADAMVAESGPNPGSVWRHRKGGLYRVVCCAVEEETLAPTVVYHDFNVFDPNNAEMMSRTWTRPLAAFADGRFTMVADAERANA